MCIDDGCDEFICCICAPLAAILCCKICKNQTVQNNNDDLSPTTAFYPQPVGRVPAVGIYGPQPPHHQAQLYPGGPQPRYPPPNQIVQGNYFPPQQVYPTNDPPGFIKQQPRPYKE